MIKTSAPQEISRRWIKFLALPLIFAIIGIISAITVTQITPTGNITTSNSSVVIQYNFTTDYLNNLTWNWDGTGYSMYDDSLVLFYNFDNRSALGENNTHVKDLSKYGNNGTVVGGSNITWTPNGKYGGAYNFSGKIGYINAENKTKFNDINKTLTISAWIRLNDEGNVTRVIVGKDKDSAVVADGFRFSIDSGSSAEKLSFRVRGRDGDRTYAQYDFKPDIWYFVSVVMNITDEWLYVNSENLDIEYDGIGANEGAINSTLNNKIFLTIGASSVDEVTDGGSWRFNGSIDDVMIFNRSLSAGEVSQLYKTQLTKYDSQNWSLITNQSLNAVLNSTTTSYNWNYKLCSANSTNEVCPDTRKVTQTIPNKNVVANFSNSIGNIRNDFYGVSYNNNVDLSVYDSVSNDMDCIRESQSDYLESRNAFINSGLKYLRINAYIENRVNSSLNIKWSSNSTKSDHDTIQWHFEQGDPVLLVFSSMFDWLANTSSPYCDGTFNRCPPN
ncbi:MAG: LamG domain-containing protein, partial [Nitrosopumilales archaeon]